MAKPDVAANLYPRQTRGSHMMSIVFAQAPIYSFGGSFVMCDGAFRILAPFIDNNYFSVASHDSSMRGTTR
jgi:hypothetical protein